MNLKPMTDRLKKFGRFFMPYFLQPAPIPLNTIDGDTALVIIDVQHTYCNPAQGRGNDETVRVSKRIKSLSAEFKKAGLPVYAVYFSATTPVSGKSKIDFFEFTPDTDDFIVTKDTDSAFDSGDLHRFLQAHGRKKLLVCGFNLAACVSKTCIDAVTIGYDVELLRDMSGNDKQNPHGKTLAPHVRHMRDKGVRLTTSHTALDRLKKANPVQ